MDRQQNQLTEGNVFSKIMLFALPIIFGRLLQEVYQLADTLIVGQTLGSLKLGAVGSTVSIVFLATGFVDGMASGCAVLTSQSFGRQCADEVKKSVATLLVICGVTAALLTALFSWGAPGLLRLANTTSTAYPHALQYVSVIYAGLPATMLYSVTSAMLRSVGNSRTPLLILTFASVLNIALDFLFILQFKWDIFGAAFATVLSQLLAGVLCTILIFRKSNFLLPQRESWHNIGSMADAEVRIGIPMGLQSAVIAIGLIVLQYYVNSFGDAAVTSFTIGSRVQILIQCPLGAMTIAMATFVGQNVGAVRYDRIQKGVRLSALSTTVYGFVMCALILWLADPIISAFVPDADATTIALAKENLRWSCPFLWALGLLFVYRGALQGFRDGMTPMIGSFVEVGMRVFVPMALCAVLGYSAVCIAGSAAWVAAMSIMIPAYFWRMRRYKKLLDKHACAH